MVIAKHTTIENCLRWTKSSRWRN